MESKQLFVFLVYCVIVNAQLISSMRKTTKIRKMKLPACGYQSPVGVPCGCGNIVSNPSYNCGCANPGMCGCINPAKCGCTDPGICGCQKYWEQIDIPSCSLEMSGPFAMDVPYDLPPETCACRSVITLPYDLLSPVEAMPLNPCGCQSARKPCGCQVSAIHPSNIYDFLSYLDIPCSCQNTVKLSNYDYVPCGCGIPQCGCQVPRDATVCGCRSGTIIPNYLPAIEPVTAVFSGLGVPFSPGCDGRLFTPDMQLGIQLSGKPACTCQASKCNCGCQRCGFGCGCGCGFGCDCGGKYLRQVTLQPPFL